MVARRAARWRRSVREAREEYLKGLSRAIRKGTTPRLAALLAKLWHMPQRGEPPTLTSREVRMLGTVQDGVTETFVGSRGATEATDGSWVRRVTGEAAFDYLVECRRSIDDSSWHKLQWQSHVLPVMGEMMKLDEGEVARWVRGLRQNLEQGAKDIWRAYNAEIHEDDEATASMARARVDQVYGVLRGYARAELLELHGADMPIPEELSVVRDRDMRDTLEHWIKEAEAAESIAGMRAVLKAASLVNKEAVAVAWFIDQGISSIAELKEAKREDDLAKGMGLTKAKTKVLLKEIARVVDKV